MVDVRKGLAPGQVEGEPDEHVQDPGFNLSSAGGHQEKLPAHLQPGLLH